MKKQGFTLIELTVSIVLVGIVLISMTGTLVKLKETYNVINEDTDARIYSATISKIINDDLIKNNGIKKIECRDDANVDSCELILGNNSKRTLEILRNAISNDSETLYSNKEIIGTKKYEKTTLRYSDSSTGNVKLLLIKTIEQITKSNVDNDNPNVTVSGYKFTDLDYEILKYENVKDDDKIDKITHITIGLSDNRYNIDLYTSGTYDS